MNFQSVGSSIRTDRYLSLGIKDYGVRSKDKENMFIKQQQQQNLQHTHRSGFQQQRQFKLQPARVPRVPYKIPRINRNLFIDLWNVLYRERVLFISKPVDDELSNQLIGTLLYLDSENDKPLYLYINCFGGDVVPTLALIDTMNYLRNEVATVGFGGCWGMAGFLLACGKQGKRYSLPNTTIMLHHPSGVARGQASDIHRESRELLRIRDYMNTVLHTVSGQSIERIQREFAKRGGQMYFDTQEAIDFGIIDRVLRPKKNKQIVE